MTLLSPRPGENLGPCFTLTFMTMSDWWATCGLRRTSRIRVSNPAADIHNNSHDLHTLGCVISPGILHNNLCLVIIGKVVERRWYERNKHIFPASRWELYDPAVARDATYTIHGGEVNGKN